jgi:hypothetical protein
VARNQRARELGALAVVSHVDVSNVAALGLQGRFGADIRGELLVLNLLGRFCLVRRRSSSAGSIACRLADG